LIARSYLDDVPGQGVLYVDNYRGNFSIHSSCINYPRREIQYHETEAETESVVLYIYARLQATTSELHANFHWSGLIDQTRRGAFELGRWHQITDGGMKRSSLLTLG
ncbi:hypothetical protein KCU67_g102, partial [Aureobasidium melanogenum]